MVTVPWLRWENEGPCHLRVVGCCPLAEVGAEGVTVNSLPITEVGQCPLNVGHCPLAQVGPRVLLSPHGLRWTLVTVTPWSEVDVGQCYLVVQGGCGQCPLYGERGLFYTLG